MKRGLILGGTLLVLASAIGGYFFMTREAISSGEVRVGIKEDGFNPETIKIKKGTKVTFVNEDEVARWPASDLHPSHGIYPEFDPKTPVKPGESWSFTFDKVGEWEYHDHLSPYLIGKITVLP